MSRTRILPRPLPSERLRVRPIATGVRRAGTAAFLVAMTLALGGCASGGGGSSQSANGISMYGTIDQGVSFRSR